MFAQPTINSGTAIQYQTLKIFLQPTIERILTAPTINNSYAASSKGPHSNTVKAKQCKHTVTHDLTLDLGGLLTRNYSIEIVRSDIGIERLFLRESLKN